MRIANLVEFLVNLVLYGGIEKEEYESIRPEIHRKNRDTLKMVSGVCTLMFLLLLASACCSNTVEPAKLLYALMLLGCGCVFGVSCSPYGEQSVCNLWYLFLVMFGIYAIILNTLIRPELSAVTLCVFLVVGPIFRIDRPYRVIGLMLMLSMGYVVLARFTKDSYIGAADSTNVACCFFLGVATYVYMNRLKLRETIQSQILKKDRDTDKLTGFLNKAAIQEQIKAHLSNPKNKGALVVMDVDNFKHVNDTYGHAYGDIVLQRAASCIRLVLPDSCLCGRFGGDEFLILVPDIDREELEKLLDTVLYRTKAMVKFPVFTDHFTMSIGVARYPTSGKHFDELFKIADASLYQVKKRGKNGWLIA